LRDRALSYYDGAAQPILAEFLKSRFAVGIKKEKSAIGDDYSTYIFGDMAKTIELGFYETVTTQALRRIVNERATLFNQATQAWNYLAGDKPAEEIEALIQEHRSNGRAKQALIRTDRIANLLQVGCLRLGWRSGQLRYYPTPPQCVYLGFGSRVNDETAWVPVDQGDIEDASVVVFRLPVDGSESASGDDSYYAYFGRSEGYPEGRAVKYASRNWFNIPEPGMDGADDYRLPSGEIANPLTWAQNRAGTERVPHEYPVIFLVGNDCGMDRLLPDTSQGLDLYHNCLELDTAWSRLLKYSLSSAQGLRVLKNPSGDPLPQTLEGVVELKGAQTLDLLNIGAANAQSAAEVVVKCARTIAEGEGIPGHVVVADDATDQQSGVALGIRYRPLINTRRERQELNAAAVERLFRLELSMIATHVGGEQWNKIPDDVRQVWDSGQIDLPTNPTEELDRLSREIELGVNDLIGLVKGYYNLPTVADAVALLEALNARKEEYGELLESAAPAKPATGPAGVLEKIRQAKAGKAE
jgi:hypothetical protein